MYLISAHIYMYNWNYQAGYSVKIVISKISTIKSFVYPQVLDVDEEGVSLSFMKRIAGLYKWPESRDTSLQPTDDIVCTVQSPELTNECSQFRFSETDLTNIQKMFPKSCLFQVSHISIVWHMN